MSGYGVMPYGSGYWGTAESIIPTATATCYATGDRVVRIVLSSEPLHISSTNEGDALNPRTWQLVDSESGKVYTIMTVTQVDAFTYDLLTLQIFPNHFGELVLSTTLLLSATGIPFPTISQPFAGVYQSATNTNERRAASLGLGIKDIANGAN